MAKHSIFGCESECNQQFDDKFTIVRDSDTSILAFSNETFQCYLDDDKQIDFRLAVEVMDSAEYTDEDKHINTILALVPSFECLNEKHKKSVAEMCGYTLDEYLEYQKDYKDDFIAYADIFDYGMYCTFGYEAEPYETPCRCVTDYDYTKQVLEAIANVYPVFGRLVGFYLDKAQNRIGETGWSYLKDWCD